MLRSFTLLIVTLLALGGLAACDSFGNPFKPETMRTEPFKKTPPKEEDSAVKGESSNQKSAQLEDYQRPVYPNGVRRNPFQPDPGFLIQQAAFESENVRVKEPLEQFGLGQLRLAAIISGISVPKAMFIDPQGLGHFARVGDRIGDGGAVITAIRDNTVVLSGGSSENSDVEGSEQILRLSESIARDESTLSEEDRAALDRILNSENGRDAIRKSLQNDAVNDNNGPNMDGGL